jgi:hypothetical protein
MVGAPQMYCDNVGRANQARTKALAIRVAGARVRIEKRASEDELAAVLFETFVVGAVGFMPERQAGFGTFGKDVQLLICAGDCGRCLITCRVDIFGFEEPITVANRV